jgi:AraC-like DNA-binding protein
MASRMDAITDSEWEERAREAHYRVSSLACGAKMSRQYLHNYFLRRFLMSPKKWLDQQKLRDALLLLRNGDLIKQLHERLGFHHPNHLARAFRRLLGRNPGACREVNPPRLRRSLRKGPKVYKKVQNKTKGSVRILDHRKRRWV